LSKATEERALTFSIQDYLKSIYELTASGEAASTNALAARLGVSAASVTGMVQKLAALRPALVVYEKHRGVRLTQRGRRAALEVIRHHRLLETWLVRSLGYPWDEVHSEAERLEHAMSDHLEQRISAALGNPDRDPHGEPIPSEHLRMPPDHSIPLSELEAEKEAVIRRVRADNKAVLRRLRELGLVIGAPLKILPSASQNEVMRVQVGGSAQAVTLASSITRSLYVEPIKKSGKSRPRRVA